MYGFRLSDGQCWEIRPGERTGGWADELACLLGLEPLQGRAASGPQGFSLFGKGMVPHENDVTL